MQFSFKATKRVEQGTGASRRLRRAGQLPGIVYGGEATPIPVLLDHNELFHMLRNEKFHTSVLNIEVEGAKETVVLRSTQWHPFRQQILHLDFQRVDATHKIHLKVPLHFINADIAPGVKLGGGMVSHAINELDVKCLPSQLPEFVEVDLKDLQAGQAIHVSQLKLPEGVEFAAHSDADPVVASILKPRGGAADDSAAEGEAKA